ncbi:MFS transporter [Stenotrophomonas sp. MMGLT7]|uniref:MFS transporter n=1 Tax=Stenotrophomonas sp. MMGLT7 TaxID=2901227 RepID=UPI001E28F0C2|nr:MFS transporter [Stenotrophomonas sp. MMGLT7]MCD7098162.1 MFS transporter [Stenotrophomonas sp. MMGLT7]
MNSIPDSSCRAPARTGLPVAVALLGMAIFAVTTAEFAVAGLIDGLARDLGVQVTAIGYLVSIYAAGMMLGGPVVVLVLARLRERTALALVLAAFALAQLVAALAPGYPLLAASRFVQGFAGAAAFGLALSIGGRIAGPGRQGQAAARIMGGLMIGTVLGLPLATWAGTQVGWRGTFAGLALVAALAALAVWRGVPGDDARHDGAAATAALRSPWLWAAFATSFLLIGGTFAAFTYFVPLLRLLTGVPAAWIPPLLALYGLATVVGNFACGRLSDRMGALPVQRAGLVVLVLALAAFALAATVPALALSALVAIGLTGVALNPAMVARVMAIDGSPLVAAVHTAVISAGLLSGSALAGVAIEHTRSMAAAPWVGAAMAALALASTLRVRG